MSFWFVQPFLSITKQMEGDMPTGAMVIPKYVELRARFQEREKNMSTSEAHHPMIAKLQGYLDKAVACETLVIATILHPAFRLKFFDKFFGTTSITYINTESTFKRVFQDYQAQSTLKKSTEQSDDRRNAASDSRPSSSAIYDLYSEDKGEGEDMGDDSQLKDYY